MAVEYKTCVVVNPFSGAGKMAKRWPDIEQKLKKSIGDFQTFFTEYPHHATTISRVALADGFNRIIVVGGDGTLSHVINGFFSEDGHKTPLNPDAVLGIIGVGTGCDTARSINIGDNIDKQIETIKTGVPTAIDLGRVEVTLDDGSSSVALFVNMCSFGISAEIVESVNKFGFGKALSGRFAYLVGALRSLLSNKNRPIKLKINDGVEFTETVALVGVANGSFCGGGVHLAPMANMTDGELDAIMIGDVGLSDLLFYMRRLFKGRHMSHPKITHQTLAKLSAHTCDDHEKLMPVEADGEFIGYLPCHMDVSPRAILVQTSTVD